MQIQPSVLFQHVGWMKLKKKRFNNDHISPHCISIAAVRRNNKMEAVGWNAPPALPSPQLGKMPVIYHCRVVCHFEDNEQVHQEMPAKSESSLLKRAN
ncbi:putative glucose-6-phosphate 1-epimerase [Trichinella pseudospiralis]